MPDKSLATPKVDDPVEVVPSVVLEPRMVDTEYGQVTVPTAIGKPAASLPTQMRHPWRSIARTWVAAVIGFAAMAPLIYDQATGHNPEAAGGLVAAALAICGGVTRVLAIPGVEKILRATPGLSWLAAAPAQ